jgi:hypothetical protein
MLPGQLDLFSDCTAPSSSLIGHVQLDFFRVQVPPCGRSSAAFCTLTRLSSTAVLYCDDCRCYAPDAAASSSAQEAGRGF